MQYTLEQVVFNISKATRAWTEPFLRYQSSLFVHILVDKMNIQSWGAHFQSNVHVEFSVSYTSKARTEPFRGHQSSLFVHSLVDKMNIKAL